MCVFFFFEIISERFSRRSAQNKLKLNFSFTQNYKIYYKQFWFFFKSTTRTSNTTLTRSTRSSSMCPRFSRRKIRRCTKMIFVHFWSFQIRFQFFSPLKNQIPTKFYQIQNYLNQVRSNSQNSLQAAAPGGGGWEN